MQKVSTAILAVLLLPLLLLSSCDDGTIYHHYSHTSSSGWRRADTMTYEIPEVKKSGEYQLLVGMRMSTDFPYRSVALVIRSQFENPTFYASDTISFNLVDKRGNLSGTGISTLSFEHHVQDMKLRQGQHGTIKLYHIMTREVLPSISDVGIKVTTPDKS